MGPTHEIQPHSNTAAHPSPFKFGAWLVMLSLAVIPCTSAAGQLDLSWVDNSENEAGFEVERSVDGEVFEFIAEVETDAVQYTDTAVLPGVPYQYRVRAFNDYGYSGYTNVSTGVVPNSAPTIDPIADISVLRGSSLPSVSFSYGDAETSDANLALEVHSSNSELLPIDSIIATFGNGEGILELAPVTTRSGVSTVTVLVSDGVATSQSKFTVEVLRNTAPTVGAIPAQSLAEGITSKPIAFIVDDAETPAEELIVTADSQNETIIATSSIVLGGAGSNRTIKFATNANQSGVSTLILSITDGVNTTKATIEVTTKSTGAPTLSGLADGYTIPADTQLKGIAFTLADQDTPLADLVLTAASSNTSLVPSEAIAFSGTGANRALAITPAAEKSGEAVVTISVFDGAKTTTHTLLVQVSAPEASVKVLDFWIEDDLAVAEVENREGAEFTLWRSNSLKADSWMWVENAAVSIGDESTLIIDPQPVQSPVFYRILADK